MGMDWPEMGFPTPFVAKFNGPKIIRKTYFYQKVGLDIPDLNINNTGKSPTDLPDSICGVPGPYLPSRRGLWPKYVSEQKNVFFFRKSCLFPVPGQYGSLLAFRRPVKLFVGP